MRITVFSDSRKGMDHEENEDSVLVDNIKKVYSIADGVTRPYGGREASKKAVKYLQMYLNKDLSKAIEKTNEKLVSDRERYKIGFTTLTAVIFKNDNIEIANVGDSPAFLIRNKKIRMLTVEDRFMGSGSLTQALGQSNIKIHSTKEKLKAGDYIILATDGITNVLTEEEMLKAAGKGNMPEKMGKLILLAAEEEPQEYNDDKSIIVIHVSE